MFMVITYDISDDARRLRVANELENWGQRSQFSVFECDLKEAQAKILVARLRALCTDKDGLRIYRLCAACVGQCEVVGGKEMALDKDFYQV
jgi:CRISPR-associated protein Cas2